MAFDVRAARESIENYSSGIGSCPSLEHRRSDGTRGKERERRGKGGREGGRDERHTSRRNSERISRNDGTRRSSWNAAGYNGDRRAEGWERAGQRQRTRKGLK